MIKPSNEATTGVHEWLEECGVAADRLKYSPAGDWINVVLSVGVVEEMLDAEYSIWEHADGSTLVRAEGYSVPHHIHEHISTIQPTNSWARLERRKKRTEIAASAALEQRTPRSVDIPSSLSPRQAIALPDNATVHAACNFTGVTVDCLRLLYGTLDYEVKAGEKNKMADTNYLKEAANRSDTEIFLSAYRPEAVAGADNFSIISIADAFIDNGTNYADTHLGGEANLDVQYLLGMAWPVPMTAYHIGGLAPDFTPSVAQAENGNEPYLTWANYMTGVPDDELPQLITTSYGDDEQTVSRAYAETVCRMFAQLGARGVTLLFASGDNGVGKSGDVCYSNVDNTTAAFLPSFPADCPYVTSVGATMDFPEVAALDVISPETNFTSGAGFSNYFAMPHYQTKAVAEYIDLLNGTYDGLYNKSGKTFPSSEQHQWNPFYSFEIAMLNYPNLLGRAYPDISCNGQNLLVVYNASVQVTDGTSASAPICGGVFALLNDALIAADRPPLGFLNPWLYRVGHKLFTDVTTGSSAGCDTEGFPAAVGWDPVTGWGTPYLPKLLHAFGVE